MTASISTRPRTSMETPTTCAPSSTAPTPPGLGVILDVVYNHLGPDGNYLGDFSPDYFTDKYTNDWGRAINFEGPEEARLFFVQNARYWIEEFHFDGLRLDATQDIKDASPRHVIADIVAAAREAAGAVPIFIVAENEPQDTIIVREPARGGYGVDALWNDDAHHAAIVALTGRREAYYTDYMGTPQELISCARFGYLYQGQWYSWQKRSARDAGAGPSDVGVCDLPREPRPGRQFRGRQTPAPAHVPRAPPRDDRVDAARSGHADAVPGPGILILGPVPVFRGSQPGAGGGRRARPHRVPLPVPQPDRRAGDPGARAAGVSRDLRGVQARFAERERHREAYDLHRDLLALRRDDPVLSRAGTYRPEGAVLGPGAWLLRYLDAELGDRLLIVNLDGDLDFTPAREPCSPRRSIRAGAWPGAARRRSMVARVFRRSIRTAPG